MGVNRVTLDEVAEAAGLSISTVSRALRGDQGVSARARELAEETASRLGYSSSRQHQSAASGGGEASRPGVGRHITVVVVGNQVREYYGATLLELVQQAGDGRYSANIVPETAETELVPALRKIGYDNLGAAVVAFTWQHLTESDARALQEVPVPVVLVNRYVEGCTNSVTVDDHAAGVQAARHLYGLGHRRIAHLPGPAGSSAARERAAGFCSELVGLGCYDPNLIAPAVVGNDMISWVQQSVASLMEQADPPTAFFTYSDGAAVACIVSLQARGLRVPEDVSVMGFDHAPAFRDFRLTSFDPRLPDLGRCIIQTVELLCPGKLPSPIRLSIPPCLVPGATTAAAPRGEKEVHARR